MFKFRGFFLWNENVSKIPMTSFKIRTEKKTSLKEKQHFFENKNPTRNPHPIDSGKAIIWVNFEEVFLRSSFEQINIKPTRSQKSNNHKLPTCEKLHARTCWLRKIK
ncbi:hypothetical protein ACFFRR_002146 [Megaselia abdita]